MNTSVSARPITSYAFSETRRMAQPRSRSSRSASSTVSDASGERPSVGSSATSSAGGRASAGARLSICCSPPDRSPAGCWRRSPSTGKRSVAALRSAGSRSSTLRFSSTVSPGKMPRASGTRSMPARARSSAGSAVTSRPLRRTRPDVASTRPAVTPHKVDLPAPFAPRSATTSPAWMVSEAPCSTSTAS